MWDVNGDKAKIQGIKGFWSPYDVQEEDKKY